MKKLVFVALLLASTISLSACTSKSGYKDGHKLCIQHELFGINLTNPCAK